MNDLFKNDWEVFVIRRNAYTGKFNWFTECCERIANTLRNANKPTAASCC